MKKFSSSDRANLIRLAASLPKGDETRRAILAGLKKASRILVLEGLDPKLQAKIHSLAQDLSKVLESEAVFVSHSDLKFSSSPTRYEETEQSEHNVQVSGFGLIGSILPKLSPKEKAVVIEVLKDQNVGIADTKILKSIAKECVINAGGWAWEDTSWSFESLWSKCKGNAVDAITLNKYASQF